MKDEDDAAEEANEDQVAVAQTLPKRATSALALTGVSSGQTGATCASERPDIPSPMRAAARIRPSSAQVHSSNSYSLGDTTFGDSTDRAGALARLMGKAGTTSTDPPIEQGNPTSSGSDTLSRRGSLMKPGVPYKIRPKRYSMTSTGRQSAASGSAISERFPDIDSIPRLHKHEKSATTSTDGGDVLTPSASMLDHLQRFDKESVVHIDADVGDGDGSLGMKECEKDDDRRLSTISTATVTFGQ